MVTRRDVLLGLFLPMTGKNETVTADVSITGHMTNAGQENERYYGIAQGAALMLDERIWPQAVKLADELLNSDVELTLARKR
jgi:hypothetical protein